MLKLAQAGFLLSTLVLAYFLGILTGRSQVVAVPSRCVAVPKPDPKTQSLSSVAARSSDPLANHRAYLDCKASQKLCRDDSPWTAEETETYVRAALARVGGEIAGESH